MTTSTDAERASTAPSDAAAAAPPWWKTGVIYQVYPRSFQDSDGDGVGDLAGIRARLGHLVELGVDAVWISPVYPSPMADFGYDVTDYTDIDPLFGTLADLDALLEAAHARGLKVLMDFVPSHSSVEHPWFAESRRSRDDPKRDWYVWRDPGPDGGPPNNWPSEFGGPAWTRDERTGQYYLHFFLPEQPSLNWRNAEVRDAMLSAMRFWLDRGVDGFRIDAFHLLVADERLRDNPPNPEWRDGRSPEGASPARRLARTHTAHQPETYAVGVAMRELAAAYEPERVLIVETAGSLEELAAYHGPELNAFQLPFNFRLLTLAWEARAIADHVELYEASLPEGAWPNWVLGNHDISRVASRIGERQAPVAAMLLLTLRGTPTIYQGEELGMTDVPIPPDAVQDPWERNVPGLGLGRDPVRTPMPWTAEEGGGFTTGEPWLPLNADLAVRNVASQSLAPDSMLSLYRRLLALRRREPALAIGDYRLIEVGEEVLVYERSHAGRRLLVALNLGAGRRDTGIVSRHASVLLSTDPDRGGSLDGPLRLAPAEGVVLVRTDP